MTKLKLGAIPDDKPVKLTVDLPAAVFQDLRSYAEAIGRESGQVGLVPARLIVPMIQRFMATDRAFGRVRKGASRQISPASDGTARSG
ncbi:MAG: DUF2274 domain-containing protein [Devosia sp.]|nr:DUF2274 domain-containing protein [Devosia sp.]